MINFVIRVVLSALALIAVAALVPGITASGFVGPLVAALALALVNAFLRPILVLLTFPITIVTLGLFLLAINAGMLLLVGHVVNGFAVHGWAAAIAGTIVLWLIGLLANRFLPEEQEIHFNGRLFRD